jgi:hypothetical protein
LAAWKLETISVDHFTFVEPDHFTFVEPAGLPSSNDVSGRRSFAAAGTKRR